MQYEDDPIRTEGEEIAEARDLGVPVSSILDQITRERDEKLSVDTVKIPIPTWEGAMVAEYKLLPRKLVEKLGKKSGKGDVNADMDFIARACVGIYANPPHLERIIPLKVGGDVAESDAPLVRYTRDLLALLGKEQLLDGKHPEDEPYVVIRHMFKNNDVAIGTHAGTIFRWMQDPSEEVANAIQGQ